MSEQNSDKKEKAVLSNEEIQRELLKSIFAINQKLDESNKHFESIAKNINVITFFLIIGAVIVLFGIGFCIMEVAQYAKLIRF